MNRTEPRENRNYRYRSHHTYLASPVSYGEIDLYQIGRLYCAPETRIELHPHLTWIELTVVTGGKGTAETNGEAVPIRQGDIHLSFPGDLHGIVSDPEDPLEYDFFSFWTKSEALLPRLEETVRICKAERRNLLRNQRIADLVSAGIGETNAPDEWSEALLGSILPQIVYSVLRDVRKNPARRPVVSSVDEICYQMMNYIDTHIYTLKNLTQLAEEMNYNYSYLSDLFRSVTGNTLRNYLRDRRLERAQLLIREGVPLRDVAEMLQYSSVYSFSRAFRDRYGVSPGRYRNL